MTLTETAGGTGIVLVLDIGKTNVKLVAVDGERRIVASRSTPNLQKAGPPYLHCDVEHIWAWLVAALGEMARDVPIRAIVPTAYGSTMAVIGDTGLALPVMDYEAEPPEDVKRGYATIAPGYDEAFSLVSAASLTPARGLYWQAAAWPEAFAGARHILTWPQYWSWRLSGVAATEITLLGAQSHLWDVRGNRFGSLVDRLGWQEKFPPIRNAFDELGPVLPAIARATGLAFGTPVLVGIHDSNANLARYLAAGWEHFTLISSGTWLITFDTDLPLGELSAEQDMVSGTSVTGRPVACTRFMGGREWAILAGEAASADAGAGDVAALVAKGTMALPSFTDSCGPCPGTGGKGRIEGPAPASPAERSALATLYVALMADLSLDSLRSAGRIVIDGGFVDNPLFAAVLATLRPAQEVAVSPEREGTAIGAALLVGWETRTESVPLAITVARSLDLPGLDAYRRRWRERIAA